MPRPGDDPALALAEADDGAVDDAVEVREFQLTAPWHGQRVDKALVSMAEEFSRNHLQG
ncbi:MAG: hypothetical protein RJA98_385, partial [Pseudomonadota bacterium]